MQPRRAQEAFGSGSYLDDSERDTVKFSSIRGSKGPENHKLPAQILGISPTGGRDTVLAVLETGDTYLIRRGQQEDNVLWSKRTQATSFSLARKHVIYVIGSINGQYLIGNPDNKAIIREAGFGGRRISTIVIDQNGCNAELFDVSGQRLRVYILPPRLIKSWVVKDYWRSVLSDAGDNDNKDTPDNYNEMALTKSGDIAVRTSQGISIYDVNGVLEKNIEIADINKQESAFAFNPDGSSFWLPFPVAQLKFTI